MLVSAVVPAYNEERNIKRMLESLLGQKTQRGELIEVVCVLSGCTDGTQDIVEAKAEKDPRVRPLVQDVRLGKTAALNAYLREKSPRAEIVVVASADVLLQPGFLDVLLSQFEADPKLGMAGGRPVPINSRDTLAGRLVAFQWDLHHEIALISPKLGEAVAVRANLLTPVAEGSPVDEASLEAMVSKQGYTLKYVPEAVIVNRGPDNVREFLRQRRRIACGHYWVRQTEGYEVSTLDWKRILPLALRHFTLTQPVTDASYALAMALEAFARAVGWLDLVRGYNHSVWRIAHSAHAMLPDKPLVDKAVPGPPRA